MVEADLPEGCSWSSSTTSTTTNDSDHASSKSTKKRLIDSLADVIKDTFESNNNEELAECKITFMSNETQRKERVYQLQLEETKLNEWLMLRENIKKLRAKLASNKDTLSQEEIEELQNDIDGLLNRKKACSKLSGMDNWKNVVIYY
jgi:hypothetical protein